MRKINIIYVGGFKASEKYYREAMDEYTKRLGAEFAIEKIEIRAEPLPEDPNQSQIDACLVAEGKKILGRLNANAFKIALCIEGNHLTSERFASLLYGEKAESSKSVDFVIGSSHGLCDEVKKTADFLLSLSSLTFSHRLAAVMLSEQLYRAYSIKTGRKYHK